MEIKLSTYSTKARLLPALIVILPISIAILCLNPEGVSGWSVLWSLLVTSGGTFLISELGRDMGKRKEKDLYEKWGGKRSIRLLRHNNNPNQTLLIRRHEKLNKLINIQLPTADEEELNKTKADEIYEICVRYLCNNTRDTKKFPLIFKELCSYGFRRNLWGMKPLGITFSATSLIYISFLILRSFNNTQTILVISFLLVFTLLLLWLFWFNRKWVEITDKAYVDRLLESIDDLLND
jgi:hypothetical protein